MSLEKSLEYRLRWFDFDRYGHIQPSTVLDLFQDMATIQATEMGIGWDVMHSKGLFWALIRLRYEVIEEPKQGTAVTVRTWPHSPGHVSFLRDFMIYDENGHVLIKGASEWVPMDVQERKLAGMKGVYEGEPDFVEERAFDKKLRKIKVPEGTPLPPYTIEPRFTDIDINGHVNNTRYPKYILDAWNPSHEFAIRVLQIDYRHEVRADTQLTIQCVATGSTLVASGIQGDDEVAFTCAIELDQPLEVEHAS